MCFKTTRFIRSVIRSHNASRIDYRQMCRLIDWSFRGGQARWALSPLMAIFRCSEWSFFNIYITDILLLSPHVATTCPPLSLTIQQPTTPPPPLPVTLPVHPCAILTPRRAYSPAAVSEQRTYYISHITSTPHQVLIYSRIKWSIWEWSVKDTTSKQCANPAPSGVRNFTSGNDIGKARLSTIVSKRYWGEPSRTSMPPSFFKSWIRLNAWLGVNTDQLSYSDRLPHACTLVR